MPYKSNNDLPDSIKNSLPGEAQTIWREAFNSSHAKDPDEEKANKIAWSAVKSAGWSKQGDKWVKMQSPKTHEFDAEIFSAGTWTDGNGVTDKYTESDLDMMVSNFNELSEIVKPPIKMGHKHTPFGKPASPALGWIKAVKRVGNKLIATLSQVPDIVMKAIQSGRYKRVSAEIYFNYKHADKIFKKVLGGVALLGADIPAVDNLADLEAYLSQSTIKGSFDTIKSYSLEVDEAGKIINIKTENVDMEKKEYEDKIAELHKKLREFQANSESDKKDKEKLEAQLAQFEKDREDEKKTSAIEKIKAFCEDSVKAGKMLPYQRDLLVNDIDKRSYSKEDGHIFSFELIEKLFEKVDKILDTGESAHDKNDGEITDPAEKLAQLTNEYMRKHPGVSYEDASNIVFEQNPKLAKAYAQDEGGED